jgi:hypothetical protein
MFRKLHSHFPYNWPSQFGPFLKKMSVCFYFTFHKQMCRKQYFQIPNLSINNFSELDLFHTIDTHNEIWNINKY